MDKITVEIDKVKADLIYYCLDLYKQKLWTNKGNHKIYIDAITEINDQIYNAFYK